MPKVGVGDRGARALAAQETFHALDDVMLIRQQAPLVGMLAIGLTTTLIGSSVKAACSFLPLTGCTVHKGIAVRPHSHMPTPHSGSSALFG